MEKGFHMSAAKSPCCLLLVFFASNCVWGAEYIDLRLDNALQSSNPNREWVLSPRIRFTMLDGEATGAVIELKRGWVVPSWKGVVESIEVEYTQGRRLKGIAKAKINSSIGVAGNYTFTFQGKEKGRRIDGTFTSSYKGEEKSGDLSGRTYSVPGEAVNPKNAVWTVQLVKGLPKSETLTVYLNCQDGKFNSAFAYSPNTTRRPIDVDASNLTFCLGKLSGGILATRLNSRQPDGGERTTFGKYEVDATLSGNRLWGEFEGTTMEGQEVAGETWGEVRSVMPIHPAHTIWLKLEDGYAGGEMWQNRVFFSYSTNDGEFQAGTASNNKGVFKASLKDANLNITRNRVSGTLHSTVHSSGSVNKGQYIFRVEGKRAGDLFHGRFYTHFNGKEDHSGYFVGTVQR